MKQFPVSATTIITPYTKIPRAGQKRQGSVLEWVNCEQMHMRIRCHSLADLNDTRQARETASEKCIRNKLNKPCNVDLITSPSRTVI